MKTFERRLTRGREGSQDDKTHSLRGCMTTALSLDSQGAGPIACLRAWDMEAPCSSEGARVTRSRSPASPARTSPPLSGTSPPRGRSPPIANDNSNKRSHPSPPKAGDKEDRIRDRDKEERIGDSHSRSSKHALDSGAPDPPPQQQQLKKPRSEPAALVEASTRRPRRGLETPPRSRFSKERPDPQPCEVLPAGSTAFQQHQGGDCDKEDNRDSVVAAMMAIEPEVGSAELAVASTGPLDPTLHPKPVARKPSALPSTSPERVRERQQAALPLAPGAAGSQPFASAPCLAAGSQPNPSGQEHVAAGRPPRGGSRVFIGIMNTGVCSSSPQCSSGSEVAATASAAAEADLASSLAQQAGRAPDAAPSPQKRAALASPAEQEQAPEAAPAGVARPVAMFGRSSIPIRLATERAPVQTVAEAQERGEHTQVVDDAIYALDGLSTASGLGTQRDSTIALAELLATRRGRVALRSDGLAQQVLTAAAKLKGQADPVVALACSCMLLSLSMPDAHPSYLASLAAAVLTGQLLQVDHDVCALLAGQAAGEQQAAASTRNSQPLEVASDGQLGRLLATEFSGQLQSHVPLVLLAMLHATSTDSARVHFASRVKHNLRKGKALDYMAAVTASRLDSLHLLLQRPPGESCTRQGTSQAPDLPGKRQQPGCGARPAARRDSPSATAGGRKGAQKASSARSSPAKAGGAVWDFPSDGEDSGASTDCVSGRSGKATQSRVLEPPPRESRLVAEAGAAASMAAAAGRASTICASLGPSLAAAASAAPLSDRVQLLLTELRLCLSVLENATFTCTENENELLGMQVCLELGRDDKVPLAPPLLVPPPSAGGEAEPSGTRPFVPLIVSLINLLAPMVRRTSASCSTPCAASRCLHAAVGLLMNLTHQHKGGVEAVVNAGALVALAELVRACCCYSWESQQEQAEVLEQVGAAAASGRSGVSCLDPLAASGPAAPAPPSSDAGNGPQASSDNALPASRCCQPSRAAILGRLDLVTVCFGLLINLTSLHPGNRDLLRRTVLRDVQEPPLLPAAAAGMVAGTMVDVAAEGRKSGPYDRQPRAPDVDDGVAAGRLPPGSSPAKDTVASGSDGVVPLLCSIFNVIAFDDVVTERWLGQAEGAESADASSQAAASRSAAEGSNAAGHVDITADELQEGHQDGEAAIVQAYSAMLLGFLVVDSEACRALACSLLRGNSLERVSAAIRRCLDFYLYTGAITEECKASLTELLRDLNVLVASH